MEATRYKTVNEHYSRLARASSPSGKDQSENIAMSFGYSADELSSIPQGANLGVSCGNPLALAGIKDGESVLDLGCGAGFDVFLAARKVGPTGIVVGVDMSTDMLARARLNASKTSTTNVRFIESNISALALEDESVGCVISNCVINLVPDEDKHLVFKEIYRVLRPGGRVAVSDILARKMLSEGIKRSMALVVGCIAGASRIGEYEEWLRDAGFEDVLIVDKGLDLNVYKNTEVMELVQQQDDDEMATGCCGRSGKDSVSNIVTDTDFNEWAGSYNVYAVKPRS